MLQYVNSFSCISSAIDNSLVLKLMQNAPVFSEDPDKIETTLIEVTSVVMSIDAAKSLAEMIQSLTNEV